MGARVCKVLVDRNAEINPAPLPEGNVPVAVVTGGGSGIGKALALQLASTGYLVVIVGRRADALTAVAAQALGKIFPCPADVGTQQGRASIASFMGSRPVSILVHCAAVCQFAALSTTPLETFQGDMRVNLEAPLFLTQMLMTNLQACTDKARVLMVSSGAADAALPTMGGYCIAKAAMKMSWKVLRDELSDVSIGYCIPGLVATEITDNMVKDPNFALKDFIAARVASGDIHPAKEAAEWMAALLNKKVCNDETFVQQEHDIDNAAHQFGSKVTVTTEARLLQQKLEGA